MSKNKTQHDDASRDYPDSTGSGFPANYKPALGDSFERDGHKCIIVDFDNGMWKVEGSTSFGARHSNRYTTEELIDRCHTTIKNGGKLKKGGTK